MLPPLVNPFSKRALRYFREDRLTEEAIAEARRKLRGEVRLEVRHDVDAPSFYALLSAASLRGYASKEARAAKEIIKKQVSSRIWALLQQQGWGTPDFNPETLVYLLEDFELLTLAQAEVTPEEGDLRLLTAQEGEPMLYAARWQELLPAVRSRRLSLPQIYLTQGYALLTLKQAIACYVEHIASECDAFLRSIEGSDSKDERLEEIAGALSSLALAMTPVLAKHAQKSLKEEQFPPCIRATLAGVGSGSRNYAITVLLTSFLSYARIAPFNAGENARIADFISDISIITEEVLPLIYVAAERCSPPLFEDQPLEKLNVSYHLGFGLTEQPRLEDSGRSPWYFVPNCEKIRREAPSLCTPDKHCRDVKNPLVYYTRKRYAKGGK
ncbi:DNA primase large subunit PriL [Candidatus Pyrohabitans sp.]